MIRKSWWLLLVRRIREKEISPVLTIHYGIKIEYDQLVLFRKTKEGFKFIGLGPAPEDMDD